MVTDRGHVDPSVGVKRGGGGGDGRNRCWVSIPKANAKDLDTRGTDLCCMCDGQSCTAKLLALLPVREKKEHLGAHARATARP